MKFQTLTDFTKYARECDKKTSFQAPQEERIEKLEDNESPDTNPTLCLMLKELMSLNGVSIIV